MLAPSSEVRGKRKRDKRVSERQPGTDPGPAGGNGAGRALSSRLARLGAVSAGHGDEGRPCFSEDWAAGEHSSARTRGADMSRRKNGGQTFFLSFFFFSPKLNGLVDSPPTPVVDRGGRGCGGRADVSVLGGVSQGCCWAEVHRFLGRPAVAQCQCVPQSD